MLAFCSMRFAEMRDCCSRLSIMIGVLGFGQGVVEDEVLVLEKMFSICFIYILWRMCLNCLFFVDCFLLKTYKD